MEIMHEPHFWTAVAFVLFFVLFGKKIWTPLSTALDNRAIHIQQALDEAENLRKEAEALLARAQQERLQAEQDAKAMIAHSEKEAVSIAKQAEEKAQRDAKRYETLLKERLASAERSALEEIKTLTANLSVDAVVKLLPDVLTEEKDKQLIDQAIADIPQAFTKPRAA